MARVAGFLAPACLTMLLVAGACSDNGSAEKIGQKIDKATEAAKETLARSDAAIGDAALAERVKAVLRKDSALKPADMSVDTREIIRAVQITRTIDGVKSVEDRLSVGPKG